MALRAPGQRLHVTSLVVAILAVLSTGRAGAETGYDLWLRYRPVENAQLRDDYRRAITHIVATERSPTTQVAVAELRRGLNGLLGVEVPVEGRVRGPGALIVGKRSIGRRPLAAAGSEGYVIRSTRVGRHPAIAGCRWPSGFEDDLLAVVLLVLEDLEAAFRLVER